MMTDLDRMVIKAAAYFMEHWPDSDFTTWLLDEYGVLVYYKNDSHILSLPAIDIVDEEKYTIFILRWS